MEKIRLEVEELAELDTSVGLSGSTKQQEVGGPLCIGVLMGIAIYSNG